MTKADESALARQLIEELRGGVPPTCDACGQETPEEQLDPYSGGEWICWECTERFSKTDWGKGE